MAKANRTVRATRWRRHHVDVSPKGDQALLDAAHHIFRAPRLGLSEAELEVVKYFLREFAEGYNSAVAMQAASSRKTQIVKQVIGVRDACDQLRRALNSTGEEAGDFLLARPPQLPLDNSFRPIWIAPNAEHIEEIAKLLKWSRAGQKAQAPFREVPQADSLVAEAMLRWLEEVNSSLLMAAEFALDDLSQLPASASSKAMDNKDRGGATNVAKGQYGPPKTTLIEHCLDLYDVVVKEPRPTLTWNNQPAVDLIRNVFEYATGLGADERGNDLRSAYREALSRDRTAPDDSLRQLIKEALARNKFAPSGA